MRHAPGPYAVTRYGTSAFEIQGGGRQLAVVGLADDRRRAHAHDVRNRTTADGRQRALALDEIETINGRDAERLATARLLAAAPELLEIARAMAARATEPDMLCHANLIPQEACARCEDILAARALLARLEGKEPARVE